MGYGLLGGEGRGERGGDVKLKYNCKRRAPVSNLLVLLVVLAMAKRQTRPGKYVLWAT